jgi:hypothetical protein
MLNWMKRRGPISYLPREPDSNPPPIMPGSYLLLHQYLQYRYADRVVLTFGQIESLIGFALPDEARLNHQWWTNVEVTAGESIYSDAWRSAGRSAVPNLLAQTVAFDRAP